ncbi:von Willebrand factor A domain-containing protein 5B1 isoform 1 precursor [Homo sapiens]|uniref:Isoform 2 of von Willebrand factor A domain-containing protein 5B1 n=2 Tax=Homo sapiens TaxID=9606 RepID=Q5TIE3-2|nr:von Willebrand factor A domain-containing protein 5B1 isoform 1 precursor [Homo sapiens]XP_011538985.1 von Willebrand factor A domain-containing protein 5B1 isoform X1 [Homo sapiens]XP_011538986.1 von Willebrand factor A domain-containing protein 5B1 isoform X1 [Homo sapiens]XP_011538987.1 von Willebrand factor A domain-containing protein 5B1 isoform X1 [Homo sapiens]EAW94921.1 hCG1812043 [Homo sapiens]|eukprot:NP_001034589.2 von Willebrand factor A domain-containing protein 5B1 precursor [Homo sapiens]
MPGLLNWITGAALPLTASDVTSCVSGYALGLTASLTYGNLEAQPFQGLFVYPLDECTTVIGFEAVIADRVVTVQIKDKAKLESGHFDASHVRSPTVTGNILQDGVSIAPHSCTPGKVTLDEDLERILFVANLGTIAPMENVTIFISTSSELPTLPSGAVRVLLPAVCAPTVPQFCTKSTGTSNQQAQGKDRHCFGAWAPGSWNKLCLATLLNTEVSNPMEYEFNFQLEIRGPCLLAGVESPTHEIRADAAPSARSAKSIIITLANKHTFDRPVEILIHPSEPHMPHVLIEKGDMTLGEFDQHLKGRTDFIKGMKKKSRAERKTEIIRKRLHKDIPHHSVIMLNFCPDLQSVQPCLRKAHGEFIFLIDRSSSMSGISMHRVKDAMLVALKSLMPACLFNIIGFGSTFKSLFPSSQTYSEDSLAMACDDIQRMKADMGGTNILSPLKWVIRQPVHRGHPRLLFVITDGAVNNTGKVLELVRNHAFSTRCYSFGIGPNVCHRLVKGLASVSEGSAELLMEGERLQPKMVKSLKKAMAPVLSDVTVEWIFPETTEVLVSPVSASSLFPGERLVGYGIVCDASLHISNPRSDKRRRYSMLHSQESGSSVFYHSQDDGPGLEGGDCAKNSGAPFILGQAKNARLASGDSTTKHDLNLSQRRRAYSTNQITNHKPLPRATMASDPMPAAKRYPLRKARLQDLTNQTSLDVQRWQIDLQPLLNSGQDLNQGPKLRGPGARRPSLLPQGCQPFLPWGQETQAWSPVRERTSDSRSPGDLEPSHHPSAFETETSSDWDPPAESQERASPSRPATPAPVLGKALVKGLHDSQRLQWEVSFELGTPGPERGGAQDADLWSETFHHLAARAIIRDFEQLAEREGEIEQGSNRRYQVSALHTSKACNIISKYTAFVPVDVSKSRYLPTVVEYPNSGAALRMLGSRALAQQWRGTSSGFGRPQTMLGEDSAPGNDMEASPTALFSEARSPGREKHGASEGPQRSLATNTLSSMKASENLFGSWLNLNKSRLLTRAAKGFLSKPLIKAVESTSGNQSFDYIPLVSLQLASGAFLLNEAFCEATHIPMEKLKWTSPFTCHRVSLTTRPSESKTPSPQLCTSSPPRHPSCDSFSLEPLAKGKLGLEPRAVVEHTGKLWATVVGLAWLEHSSASYFTEWELVAAKANSWLEQQEVPEGRTQGTLKAAARQLFVLLRHWDENLEFNMLCYNPNYV